MRPKLPCAAATPCLAAFIYRVTASLWSCSTPSPLAYRLPRLDCASANSCSAAFLYHVTTSLKSCFAPLLCLYVTPRLNCAFACPCSAQVGTNWFRLCNLVSHLYHYVHGTNAELRRRIPQRGRFHEPRDCPLVVLFHTCTFGVRHQRWTARLEFDLPGRSVAASTTAWKAHRARH